MGVKVSFKFSIANLHSNEFPAAVSCICQKMSSIFRLLRVQVLFQNCKQISNFTANKFTVNPTPFTIQFFCYLRVLKIGKFYSGQANFHLYFTIRQVVKKFSFTSEVTHFYTANSKKVVL